MQYIGWRLSTCARDSRLTKIAIPVAFALVRGEGERILDAQAQRAAKFVLVVAVASARTQSITRMTGRPARFGTGHAGKKKKAPTTVRRTYKVPRCGYPLNAFPLAFEP